MESVVSRPHSFAGLLRVMVQVQVQQRLDSFALSISGAPYDQTRWEDVSTSRAAAEIGTDLMLRSQRHCRPGNSRSVLHQHSVSGGVGFSIRQCVSCLLLLGWLSPVRRLQWIVPSSADE